MGLVMKAVLLVLLCALHGTSWGQGCEPMPKQTGVEALPSGTLLENIGASDMPISTKSEKAKRFCNQGFALIHCFWFKQAIQSFRDAVKEDPTCAIAWCGLNLSLTQPWAADYEFKAEADYAIKRAIANIESGTEAEQDLIRACRLRSMGQGDRDPQFEKAMAAIVAKYPLAEPRLLWSGIRCQLCMHGYQSNGDINGDLTFVIGLIEPILKRDPSCAGALHYAIHAYEPANPQKAVDAARRLEKIGSGSAHMTHMPGHIFNRVGYYAEAADAFAKSRAFDERIGRELKVPPGMADWQYLHNIQFQCLNLSEMGRIKEAAASAGMCGWTTNLAWRQGSWSQLTDGTSWKEDKEQNPNLRTAFRGLAALAEGDLPTAHAKLAALQAKVAGMDDAKEDIRTERRILVTASKELEGQILVKEGRLDDGIKALRDSVAAFTTIAYFEPPQYIRPPHESLGYILIDAGRTDEAVAAFKDGLKARPFSGWMHYGIALAYEKGGKMREARKAYEEFLKAWPTADADLPQVVHAKEFLAAKRPNRSRRAA